jgi:hypothetical protein
MNNAWANDMTDRSNLMTSITAIQALGSFQTVKT